MRFLRYPGGKSKQLSFLAGYLPNSNDIKGTYIEPFVGGGSVFFNINPNNSIISDLNQDLITLYRGIRTYPHKVWEVFEKFPPGKLDYYKIRNICLNDKPFYYKAARILYLNRTCFKGMWRHNTKGDFNVGYGGEERRWVINHKSIVELSKMFRKAEIKHGDFEEIINLASNNDFIFLDPPYKPGERDLHELHYINGKFLFNEQIRLSKVLKKLPKSKKIKWAMTNSAHPCILSLYKDANVRKIPIGTGSSPGISTKDSHEVLITNY